MNKLTETYYKLVKAGALDIEKVPEKYREAVREKIEKEGELNNVDIIRIF